MVNLDNLEKDSNFAPLLLHHMSNLEEDDKDVEELFENFDGPSQVFPYVVSLKDEGNSLYKLNDFNKAILKYNKAIKCLCVAISAICDDISDCENNSLFRELIVSLTLNLAACELKSDNLCKTSMLCSLVLGIDTKNVKALFRRGVVSMKLGYLENAYEDLKKAKDLEPKNKDIAKELAYVESVISMNLRVGKEKMEKKCEFELSLDLKSVEEQELSSGCDSMVLDNQSVLSSKVLTKRDESMIAAKYEAEESLDGNKDSLKVKSIGNLPQGGLPNHSLKSGKVTFVNKRKPHLQLNMSYEDVIKLRKGKDIQVYHPKSMTILKVRTFPPKSNIKMEAPRNHVLSFAAVSKEDESKGSASTESRTLLKKENVCVQEDEVISKKRVQVQTSEDSMEGRPKQPNNESSFEEQVHDDTYMMEAPSEASSCMTHDYSSHTTMFTSSSTFSQPRFKSKIKRRKWRFDAKSHGPLRQGKNKKSRNSSINKNISLSSINHDCGCRSEFSRKRRSTSQMERYHPPTKKLATHVCGYPSINAYYVGCSSFKDFVCVTHEEASSQSNG